MNDVVKPKVLLLESGRLTPALVSALRDNDLNVDMVMFGPDLNIRNLREGIKSSSPDHYESIDFGGCQALMITDLDQVDIGFTAEDLRQQVGMVDTIDVIDLHDLTSLDLLFAANDALDRLRFDLHDPWTYEAPDHLSDISSMPIHHQLNQHPKRPGKQPRMPKRGHKFTGGFK